MTQPNLQLAERSAKFFTDKLIHSKEDFPVDPFEVATRSGIDWAILDDHQTHDGLALEPGVSGRIAFSSTRKPLILIRRGAVNSRMRFTMAHELGHYILHSGKEHTDYTLNRADDYKPGSAAIEAEANRFAAALLMPTDHFIDTWKQFGRDGCTSVFGVSTDAAKFRAISLEREGLAPNLVAQEGDIWSNLFT